MPHDTGPEVPQFEGIRVLKKTVDQTVSDIEKLREC
jgi:hypothetical protein